MGQKIKKARQIIRKAKQVYVYNSAFDMIVKVTKPAALEMFENMSDWEEIEGWHELHLDEDGSLVIG